MSILEPRVTIIGLGTNHQLDEGALLNPSDFKQHALTVKVSAPVREENNDDEHYWNNSHDLSNNLELETTGNNNRFGNLTRTDFYNNINHLLTINSKLPSSSFNSTPVETVNPSHSIQVYPTNNKLFPIYSERDILNMGKIQEFREKVGVSQVAMPRKDIWRCLMAEFLGTFLLVLVGCGSTIHMDPTKPGPSLLGVALCFALMVATLASTLGHVSGCHINPAVTVAMFVTGKIELVKGLLYVLVQCLAGILAIGALKVIIPAPSDFGNSGHALEFGYVSLSHGTTPLQGFAIEFFITFILVFVIFAICDENRTDHNGSGPLAIGLALAAVIIFGGPFTGAGINPSRVLGPCVILGKFEDHWIYWLGPISGAIVAGAIYEFIFRGLRADEMEAQTIAREKKSRERESHKENGVAPEV